MMNEPNHEDTPTFPEMPKFFSPRETHGVAAAHGEVGSWRMFYRKSKRHKWLVFKDTNVRGEASDWLKSEEAPSKVENVAAVSEEYLAALSAEDAVRSKSAQYMAVAKGEGKFDLYEWAAEDNDYVLIRSKADLLIARSWLKNASFI
jgi:hypothetical protein